MDPKASMDSMRVPVLPNTDAPGSSKSRNYTRSYSDTVDYDKTHSSQMCRHCNSMIAQQLGRSSAPFL